MQRMPQEAHVCLKSNKTQFVRRESSNHIAFYDMQGNSFQFRNPLQVIVSNIYDRIGPDQLLMQASPP